MAITNVTGLSRNARAELRRGFGGDVLAPDDPEYEARRHVWNRMIDRHPAVIARCSNAADIGHAFRFARRHDLPFTVRGGGHNVAGSAVLDDAVMIDCSPMKAVRVDPATRRVDVEPGVLLGELDAATEPFGLAVSAGVVTETGVAGLTLGGGIGWLMRRDGLTCDRLRAAEVLAADGEWHHTDEDTEPDLFWSLRGGGGNFGIVTQFSFEAAPLEFVTAGVVLFALEDASEVLRRYRDWAAHLPREATTILALRTVLALPAFPTELHGRRILSIGLCSAGTRELGAPLHAGLRAMGRPLFDSVGETRFSAHQRTFDASVPAGHGYYWKSHFLAALSDGAIDALVEGQAEAPQPWSYSILFQMGGAVADLPTAASAFPGRDAAFALNINGAAARADEDAAVVRWARTVFNATEPFSTGGVYVNFVGDEGDARARAAYGASFDRLAMVKARWDPANLFRANQNIRPSPGE